MRQRGAGARSIATSFGFVFRAGPVQLGTTPATQDLVENAKSPLRAVVAHAAADAVAARASDVPPRTTRTTNTLDSRTKSARNSPEKPMRPALPDYNDDDFKPRRKANPVKRVITKLDAVPGTETDPNPSPPSQSRPRKRVQDVAGPEEPEANAEIAGRTKTARERKAAAPKQKKNPHQALPKETSTSTRARTVLDSDNDDNGAAMDTEPRPAGKRDLRKTSAKVSVPDGEEVATPPLRVRARTAPKRKHADSIPIAEPDIVASSPKLGSISQHMAKAEHTQKGRKKKCVAASARSDTVPIIEHARSVYVTSETEVSKPATLRSSGTANTGSRIEHSFSRKDVLNTTEKDDERVESGGFGSILPVGPTRKGLAAITADPPKASKAIAKGRKCKKPVATPEIKVPIETRSQQTYDTRKGAVAQISHSNDADITSVAMSDLLETDMTDANQNLHTSDNAPATTRSRQPLLSRDNNSLSAPKAMEDVTKAQHKSRREAPVRTARLRTVKSRGIVGVLAPAESELMLVTQPCTKDQPHSIPRRLSSLEKMKNEEHAQSLVDEHKTADSLNSEQRHRVRSGTKKKTAQESCGISELNLSLFDTQAQSLTVTKPRKVRKRVFVDEGDMDLDDMLEGIAAMAGQNQPIAHTRRSGTRKAK
ncbi:hypothetical protein MBLNU459_g5967t1 [Dothideomycetes sp. NU459]